MTTYEGGVRVPAMARWPGKIPAGTKLNGIQGHQDLFTTLAAAAGVPDVAERVMKEKKQVIDGVNNLPPRTINRLADPVSAIWPR